MSWKIIFLIQLIGFIPSFIFKTDHYFDLTGGITFILIISLATNKIILNESLNYKVVPFFLVFLWAIRLSSFLFLRVKKVGKDIRFDNLKTNFWKFMLSWVVQGFWVFMSLLPLLIVVDSSKSTNIIFLVIGFLFCQILDEILFSYGFHFNWYIRLRRFLTVVVVTLMIYYYILFINV